MAHDVFICYAASDRKTADAVCGALEKAGLCCWMAPRDIPPGTTWASSIIEGIAQSRLVVLIFSSHANRSAQVMREVDRAVHHGVRILPVRIEEVVPAGDMEYFLSTTHWLDAFPPPFEAYLEHLTKVATALSSLAARGEHGTDARLPVWRDLRKSAVPPNDVLAEAMPKIILRACSGLEPLATGPLGSALLEGSVDIAVIEQIKRHAKDLAKNCAQGRDKEMATVLYYAAIAGALVFHGKKTTKSSNENLQRSFEQLIALPWVPPEICGLMSRAAHICCSRRGE